MKKLNSKSFLVLIFSIFVFTCFYSCEKSGKLDGTTWKSGSFEAESTDLQNPGVLRIEEVTISFKKENAYLEFTISEIYDPILEIIYKDIEKISRTTPYTYDENGLSMNAIGVAGFAWERKWGGTINGKKMNMHMLGTQVEFKKK